MITTFKLQAPSLKPGLEGVPEIFGTDVKGVAGAVFLAGNLCTEDLDFGLAYQVLRYALVLEVERFVQTNGGDRMKAIFARPEIDYVKGCDLHARHLLNAVAKIETEHQHNQERVNQELQRLGLMYGKVGCRIMASVSPSGKSRRQDNHVTALQEAATSLGFRLTDRDIKEAFSPMW